MSQGPGGGSTGAPAGIGRRVVLAAGAAGLALLGQSVRAAEGWPAALRIGWLKVGPLVMLRRQETLERLLAPRGITVSWVPFGSGPPVLEALNAGAIDFAFVGDMPPIFAQAAGAAFVYVGAQPMSGATQGLVVPRDSPLRAVAGLRGRRVGVTRGSSAHNYLVRALELAGMAPDDVRIAYLQPPDAAAAFRQGSLDAWAIWDPFFAVAQQDPDARTLATGAGVTPSNSFFLARRAYAEACPELMRLLVGQVDEIARWSADHQAAAAQIMAETTGVPLPAQAVALARGAFSAGPMTEVVVGQQQAIADRFAGLQLLPEPVRVRDAVWRA